MLRLPLRAIEGERLLVASGLVLVSPICSSSAVGDLGDFEPIDLINGKFLNMLL